MMPRVTEEVKHHLSVVGARIPVDQGLTLSCFGIMYEDQNSKCMGCGVKSACVVETRSLGLDKITPHPSILGTRPMRVPLVNVGHNASEDEDTSEPTVPRRMLPIVPSDDKINERSIEIINFLDANFKRAEQAINDHTEEKVISYALKSGGTSKSPILWLNKTPPYGDISLRFTKPSPALKSKLHQETSNGLYLPKTATAKEAIKLIEALANEKSRSRSS